MDGRKSLVLKNQVSELERMAQEISSWCHQQALPCELEYKMNLVLDEIVSNIIRHGFKDHDDHEISVRFSVEDGELTMQVEDDGGQFDPLGFPSPDITKHIEERRFGGMGIFLVRQIVDRLEYQRRDGRNLLTMRKRLNETQK